MALKYDSFAHALNAMFNAANVKATAYALQNFEQKSGRRYEFGSWAPTLGGDLGDGQWGGKDARASWGRSVADIPPVIRKQLGYLIRENLLAAPPMPIIFEVKLGPEHGVEVGNGKDKSTGTEVDALMIKIVCRK